MLPSISQRQRYSADPEVRNRLQDFLGATPVRGPTAVYFAAGTETASLHRIPRPLDDLPTWLDRGAELNRSLWDRDALLVHLDLEYVNFDFPAHPYLDPARIFACQEALVKEIRNRLGSFGITPLHLLTGRGHHFVWKINRNSPAFDRLRQLGRPSESLLRLYAGTPGPNGEHVDSGLAAAFSGLGLTVEHFAGRIRAETAPRCPTPVELAAIEAGGTTHGREVVSLDITEYADPLCSRVIRVPFSIYLKPWQMRDTLGRETADGLAPIFIVPAAGLRTSDLLKIRNDPEAVRRHAANACTTIPDASAGMLPFIEDYLASPLARFHEWYHSQEPPPESQRAHTCHRPAMPGVPPCVNEILTRPNDLLLRPACAGRVVRVMLALGWHPRQIAGLIGSIYAGDHRWGDQWRGYDPFTRADFYARVFSGIFAAGLDDLVDFNCQSAREEGLCFVEPCSENLSRFRDSLLNRRKYERLGCRPVNGLLFSDEHS